MRKQTSGRLDRNRCWLAQTKQEDGCQSDLHLSLQKSHPYWGAVRYCHLQSYSDQQWAKMLWGFFAEQYSECIWDKDTDTMIWFPPVIEQCNRKCSFSIDSVACAYSMYMQRMEELKFSNSKSSDYGWGNLKFLSNLHRHFNLSCH